MTCRLLPLLLISLQAIIIIASVQLPTTAAATAAASTTTNTSKLISRQPRTNSKDSSRQHKAFFVNYPVMQRVYKDKDLQVSETRKRHKQRLRKPSKSKPESEIYFIKLPPAPYSYVEGLGYISQPPVFNPASLPKPKPKPKPFVKVPIDFVSNGKPTKVYHWPNNKHDNPLIKLNRGPYSFNGKPTGIYVIKNKPKRKPAVLTNEYKKKVVLRQ